MRFLSSLYWFVALACLAALWAIPFISIDQEQPDAASEAGGVGDFGYVLTGEKEGAADATRASAEGTPARPQPATADRGERFLPGATGAEPRGLIPVCVTPRPEERALADEVFQRLNDYRAEQGLARLIHDEGLARAAQGHARHMAEHSFYAHEAPEPAVASPWARAEQCGSVANGENIAAGQPTAAAVMEGWKKSPGHNANMLNDGFRRVGIGAHVVEGSAPSPSYWVQLFEQ